ncbi:unnamed protein product [Rotaria sp. Silwood2]|nr:unnamed protein product [Rotaria sp. Silwood2]CAF4458537.1 unnamed protein product [Rotaria sp. Silwood2]CAF4616234.1 unnamed protein product [Rotaria sp. Silwood2]
MYNSSSLNINDENIEQQLSQEYSDKSYHDMQPASFVSISQSTVDINHQGSSSFRVRDPPFDIHRPTNQPLSSIYNSITSSDNNYVAPVTSTELPAKKRRTAPGTLVAPSTAPLPRKRFNPAVQSTAAAAMMNNVAGGENTLSSRTVAAATKSISETTQNGFNQMMKPLIKLCEETNQLVIQMLKQSAEQTCLMNNLINFPRELQKATEKLSHAVHMVLNGINLVRTAYGETASFNDLASGEFDLLLTFIARIHQINVASVISDSQSIKNSLQQMKHDNNKKNSSTRSSITLSKREISTTVQPSSLSNKEHDDDDDDDDEL